MGALDRETLSQIIIVLGVTVGGWMVLVMPKVSAIDQLEAQIATYESIDTGAGEQTIEELARQTSAMRDAVAQVRQRNQLAGDSSRLYQRISALARAYGLKVQTIRPGGAVRTTQRQEGIVITPVDITVEGSYQAAAEFCAAVVELGGYVRARSLSVTPRDQSGGVGVMVRFTCEALQFPLPDELAMAEVDDAE